jgi:hypothetical protein
VRNHHGPKSGIFGPLSFRDDQLQVDSLLDRFGGVTTVGTGSTRNSSSIELTERVARVICNTQHRSSSRQRLYCTPLQNSTDAFSEPATRLLYLSAASANRPQIIDPCRCVNGREGLSPSGPPIYRYGPEQVSVVRPSTRCWLQQR